MEFYQVMAVSALLYGSECWTMGKKDTQTPQAAEMRFLRSVKGCTRLDKIRNEDIRKNLECFQLMTEYEDTDRQDRLEHVERMEEGRVPKQALWYRPKGR
jgi:hypothetical protein